MKDKIKKLFKNKYFKIIITILIGLIIIREIYCIYVDIYNFRQLEKAKPYLEQIDEDTERFYNLEDFNEMFDVKIKPIKNCYSINNNNGIYLYKFGFKLESLIYRLIYWEKYYTYPGYDTPYRSICMGGCYDSNRASFERVISNPCK